LTGLEHGLLIKKRKTNQKKINTERVAMFKTNYLKISSFFLIVGFLFVSILPHHVLAEDIEPQTPVFVDPQVVQDLQSKGTTSYWIDFKNQPDLTPAFTMDWRSRGQYVYEQLSKEADQSQRNVRAYLDEGNISYQSFWIKNSILVLESNLNVVNGLLNFSEISAIRPIKEYILYAPEQVDSAFDNGINGVGSNISRVKADQAWALGYTGEGLVVANIDTGVRYTHQALVNQYRGNLGGGSFDHDYNWFDPYNTYLSPADGHGHGTHTMGTAIGDDGGANQIGMAPGANWIACRGCNSNSCADSALLTCAQFITAPTKIDGTVPNPDLRAHVVNNSWGDCNRSYDDWYQDVVDAWHAAGIYPVFSNGNNSNCGYSRPPGLNTVGNPARYGNVTGVGSSGNSDGQYATHSNWGPTDNPDTINAKAGFDMMKPQVVAPGVNIRSSVPSSDTAYQNGWSGTSMSAPHVTGLVALMWQAGPCLVGDYALTETLLEDTATPMTYDDGSPLTPTNYPNFATGWGEINALAAVQAAASICGATTLRGVVSGLEMCDVNPAPLGGATVNIYDHGVLLTSLTTDSGGNYIFALDAGTYDLEVIMNGYVTQTVFGVVLEEGANLVNNFELRLDAPCLSVAPTSLVETLAPDRTKTQTLKLSNTGAGKADFTLIEVGSSTTTMTVQPVPQASNHNSGTVILSASGIIESKAAGQPYTAFPMADVELILDDGSRENGIGVSNDGSSWEFIFLNRFTPGPGVYPFTLNEIQVYFASQDQVQVGHRMDLVVYENTSGNTDPAVGAHFLARFPVEVEALNAWNTYALPGGVVLDGPGDVLIGVIVMETPATTSYWPAALDETTSQGRSWAGWWLTSPPPAEPTLPPDEEWMLIDDFLPGNWMIRGKGSFGGGDVPWLSENPVSGTIPPGGEVNITVTFDSTGLGIGDYFAIIRVSSPQAPTIDVPVTMHVVGSSNHAPVAKDQAVTTPFNTPIAIFLVATDPDGDVLAYSIVGGPGHGVLEYGMGELPALTYIPNPTWSGVDSFTFKANDGLIDSNIATVTITVGAKPLNKIFLPLIRR
jgi:subtilisin family serine protease